MTVETIHHILQRKASWPLGYTIPKQRLDVRFLQISFSFIAPNKWTASMLRKTQIAKIVKLALDLLALSLMHLG